MLPFGASAGRNSSVSSPFAATVLALSVALFVIPTLLRRLRAAQT